MPEFAVGVPKVAEAPVGKRERLLRLVLYKPGVHQHELQGTKKDALVLLGGSRQPLGKLVLRGT